jgi:hypothetical protein
LRVDSSAAREPLWSAEHADDQPRTPRSRDVETAEQEVAGSGVSDIENRNDQAI